MPSKVSFFEELTAEAVKQSLTSWEIHPTGWTRGSPVKLATVVKDIALLLGEATGDLARWASAKANEAGLDLLCFRPFPDGRVGIPVYLFQCASGSDWKTKLKTPDLDLWTKIITFASHPKKAFSMPFALPEDEFIRRCANVNGLLLDRQRLLAAGLQKRSWMSSVLAKKVNKWTAARVRSLPQPT